MIEILPVRLLTPEDAPVFGGLNVALAKLARLDLPVGNGIVVTSPQFKLKAVLEHFDFVTREVFRQSLTLVKKEVSSIPVPQVLLDEAGKHQQFFFNGQVINTTKSLWLVMLSCWLGQIEQRLWNNGFYPGITEGLDPAVIIFVKKVQAFGTAYFDSLEDDVQIRIKFGKLHPNDLRQVFELVQKSNKKLFIPHEYGWVLDRGVKFVKVLPYTPATVMPDTILPASVISSRASTYGAKSAVRVFFELSSGFAIEKNIDGIYLDSGKVFNPDKPGESYEEMLFKLVESAASFPDAPVFFKLADKSEGMGKVRGALRLLHQKSLFEPLLEALDFVRHKKKLINVQVVIPFVRGINELLQIKRELAAKKLMRKNSFQIWMEVGVPENVINLDKYLAAGIDGVVLNLNELIAYLNGFDHKEDNLSFYKNEIDGLMKFLEGGIKLLHKSKTPFIVCGNLSSDPKLLEFLVEKGVFGIVVERYEAHSAKDLLYQVEKRMVLRKSNTIA